MTKNKSLKKIIPTSRTTKKTKQLTKIQRQKVKYIQLGGAGKCDFDNSIGAGEFGTVFLCKLNNKTAVLKISKQTPDAINSIENEKKILLKLEKKANNNIVKYIADDDKQLTLFEKPNIKHYFMEYCELGNLNSQFPKQKLKDDKPIFIGNVFEQVLSGLKYLFENSIIHSDIKPENILVKQDGNGKLVFKISDFGCAVNVDDLEQDADGNVKRTLLFRAATTIIMPSYLKYSTYFRDLYALYCLIWYLYYGKHLNTLPLTEDEIIKLINKKSGLNEAKKQKLINNRLNLERNKQSAQIDVTATYDATEDDGLESMNITKLNTFINKLITLEQTLLENYPKFEKQTGGMYDNEITSGQMKSSPYSSNSPSPGSQPEHHYSLASPGSQPEHQYSLASPGSQPEHHYSLASPGSQPEHHYSLASPGSQPEHHYSLASQNNSYKSDKWGTINIEEDRRIYELNKIYEKIY